MITLTYQNSEARIFSSKQEYEDTMKKNKAEIDKRIKAVKALPELCSREELAETLNVDIDVVHANILSGHVTTKFKDGRSLVSTESVVWALMTRNFMDYKLTKR